MIEKHGGVEDFVVDPFGFKYQVRRNFAPGGHVDEDGGKHNICIFGFMIFLSASLVLNIRFGATLLLAAMLMRMVASIISAFWAL